MSLHTSEDFPTLLDALRRVYDPEVGVNIVDLGLIYRLEQVGQIIQVDMTMTSPACPMGESIACEVEETLLARVPAGCSLELQLVWEPPWTPACMSDKARANLGWEG